MSYLGQARLVRRVATTLFAKASGVTALFVMVVLLSFSTHAGAIPLNWNLSM
jgi:hypothetical protein